MRSGFVKIDRAIIDSEIGDDIVAAGLYLFLASISNWSSFNGLEKGQAIVSIKELSERFGISRRTISRKLSLLDKSGIITRERIGNLYIFKIEKFIDYTTGRKPSGERKMFDF